MTLFKTLKAAHAALGAFLDNAPQPEGRRYTIIDAPAGTQTYYRVHINDKYTLHGGEFNL